ncbi:MAG: protein kinase [Cyanobacteria bacterium REEB67]|nr:protein kinase [Cyanobacteria bacterium REEB67]
MKPEEKDRSDRRPIGGWKLGSAFGAVTLNLRQNEKADFSQGAMSGKFSRLKQEGLGTTFNRRSDQTDSSKLPQIDLATGAIIGGAYEIIKMIGRGGMGEVYLAEHRTLKKNCALKLIPPEQVTEVGWHRFQQEAKAFAKLDHVNLVKVSDLGIHEGCLPFYAMELVVGKTLADMLAGDGPMGIKTALEIFTQVCDGVAYAHRVGIIHRDIKPANIMVVKNASGKTTVKILDFGLAKLTQQDRERQSMTSMGDVFGSPYYMSPEQCAGHKVDNRSDIYSIGCTLFECLTGRPPFDGHSSVAIIFSHQEADPPSLTEATNGHFFPKPIETVMEKLLRKDPDERYQIVTELRIDLEKLARGEEITPYRSKSDSNYGGYTAGRSAPPWKEHEDEEEPDLDTDEDASTRNKLITAALLVVLLAAATSAVYFFVPGPWHAHNRKATTAATAGTTGNSTITAAAATTTALATPEPLSDGVTLAKSTSTSTSTSISTASAERTGPAAPKSLDEKKLYSTLVKEGKHTYRQFQFPTDIVIGTIAPLGQPNWVLAQGPVRFRDDTKLVFSPSSQMIEYPAYCKRFRPDDFYQLYLSKRTDASAMLEALAGLPVLTSLQSVRLTKEEKLSQKSLDLLNKCKSIKSFECTGMAIDATALASMSWLKKIERLTISDYSNTDEIFAALRNNDSLNWLDLANCKLSAAGLKDLQTLRGLIVLNTARSLVVERDLPALKDLPKLAKLRIDDPLPFNPNTLEGLYAIKPMRVLVLGPSNHYPNATKYKLQMALRQCKIVYEDVSP